MNKRSFESFGIGAEIQAAIAKLGYIKPTDVQHKVIPLVLENQDVIVKAQTGSGKTAAFAIPLCEKIEVEVRRPQVLVLTPTRELCVQVKENISEIGRFKRIRCAAIFGKQPFYYQARELQQRTHVVVGTPGRTLDHLEKGSLDVQELRYLVIDEADEMLNMGFIEQVEAIINLLPKARVTLLFSATISNQVEELSQRYMLNPITVLVSPETVTTEKIDHVYYEVEEGEKFRLLEKILVVENPDSCMIFGGTKEKVDQLFDRVNGRVPCLKLHGGMVQGDRLQAINSFKRGEYRYLVATDVAARGIDIENVTHVINYDVPMEKESYVHRIGRSGRAGKKGRAITFVTPREMRFLSQIEEFVGFKIAKGEVPGETQVNTARNAFVQKIEAEPELKDGKIRELNKDISKLYISAGKKKKIRPGDVVGVITGIEGITAEDIGIIDIQDSCSFVDILNGKGYLVLTALKAKTIKGKVVKVHLARE